MSVRKLKVIIGGSIILNIILAGFVFSYNQENNAMKTGGVVQYASQQEEVLFELERALENQDVKEEFVKALTSAYSMIYHNYLLTRNYTTIGEQLSFPENINHLNSPWTSRAVGHALFESTTDRLDTEAIQELEQYTSYVSQIVDILDYRNRIDGHRLNEQLQVLEETSDLIESFNLD
ncbi:hypothetical protein ACERII_25600 [Evansella sp. AB-rgal1]|uniref:hypothetical protein n=1 Tax=Evansella sp. AB-rgal1 TaxID=3242696 RepID=UPI00359DF612